LKNKRFLPNTQELQILLSFALLKEIRVAPSNLFGGVFIRFPLRFWIFLFAFDDNTDHNINVVSEIGTLEPTGKMLR